MAYRFPQSGASFVDGKSKKSVIIILSYPSLYIIYMFFTFRDKFSSFTKTVTNKNNKMA